MRGRNQEEHASGTIPSLPKMNPMRAWVEQRPGIHGESHRGSDAHSSAVDRSNHRLGQCMDGQRQAAPRVTHAVLERVGAVVGRELLGARDKRLVEPEHVPPRR